MAERQTFSLGQMEAFKVSPVAETGGTGFYANTARRLGALDNSFRLMNMQARNGVHQSLNAFSSYTAEPSS